MERKHVGSTQSGEKLMGCEISGVRHYYLNDRLVAVATGDLSEESFTNYFCLSGIWHPDHRTQIVDEAELLRIVKQ